MCHRQWHGHSLARHPIHTRTKHTVAFWSPRWVLHHGIHKGAALSHVQHLCTNIAFSANAGTMKAAMKGSRLAGFAVRITFLTAMTAMWGATVAQNSPRKESPKRGTPAPPTPPPTPATQALVGCENHPCGGQCRVTADFVKCRASSCVTFCQPDGSCKHGRDVGRDSGEPTAAECARSPTVTTSVATTPCKSSEYLKGAGTLTNWTCTVRTPTSMDRVPYVLQGLNI